MMQPLRPSLSAGAVPTGDDAARRKRLGQYFTGEKLARLLVTLANPTLVRHAIDPMCGSGDMLATVRSLSPQVSLAGIEIDSYAYEHCLTRLARIQTPISLLRGNAFSWSVISSLPATSFDLVVTNPPYVRYQSYAGDNNSDSGELPRAEDVRRGLMEVAQNIGHLEEKDREILVSIIQAYSGLSDLAVPSWILCMMLTAVGGRLAIVVPETWLNRDYAYPIHYLLLKLFRILYVVEDANRVWFEGAQVKTTLLVAERVLRADNLLAACDQQTYIHASVPASAINEDSIIGGVFPKETDPEATFAQILSGLNSGMELDLPHGFKVTKRSLSGELSNLLAAASGSKWLRSYEPELTQPVANGVGSVSGGVNIPQALFDMLPSDNTPMFKTIESLGGRVGQGLRTGANEFFYCDLISESELDDVCLISPGNRLKLPPVEVPKGGLRVVLRRQNETPKGYVLDPSVLRGRALILDGFIHPSDLAKTKGEGESKQADRAVMPPALASFVSDVEGLNIGTEDQPKAIPQLTAVRTNETKNKNISKARFWYMLPSLANRHRPDLFIPRINYRHPRTFLNSDDPTIIDANFSTIWLIEGASIDAFALLACLNSSWIVAAMELSAAVMGGGALKLEATHIRRLPLPVLPTEQRDSLSKLGRRLAHGDQVEKTLHEINKEIAYSIFGLQADFALERIEIIIRERLEDRQK